MKTTRFPAIDASQFSEGAVRIIAEDIDMKVSQTNRIKINLKRRMILKRAIFVTTLAASLSGGATVVLKENNPNGTTSASLTTALTGSNNDLVFTARAGGLGGNGITVAYINPGTASHALAVAADLTARSITVTLATDAGTKQVETATAAGTITTAGNVAVTVLSGATGTVTLAVAAALNDTASQWAAKVRTALAANTTIAANFVVSGSTTAIVLTPLLAAANDTTLNIGLADGTSVGVTTAASSANTTPGVAPAITSTSALIKAAIEANTDAMRLVSIAHSGADDGTGIVTALAATPLASGAVNVSTDVQTVVASGALSSSAVTDSVEESTVATPLKVIQPGNDITVAVTAGAATTDKKSLLLEFIPC